MDTLPFQGPLAPSHSALQSLLDKQQVPTGAAHPKHAYQLALQVLHNLQHQHQWTHLNIHTQSPLNAKPLARPLISGLPPQRLYIHPDEQIELLQQQKDAGKKGMPDLRSEREWVLPSHLREGWSLRRFGEIFADIGLEPGNADEAIDEDARIDSSKPDAGIAGSQQQETPKVASDPGQLNKWRTTKRLLLATLDDDSTVVYYIIHDGLVKPRQN